MVNSLNDFFIRRTSQLYFDINSIKHYKSIVIKDISKYLNWDTNRIQKEEQKLNIALKDATTFYDEDFKQKNNIK
jgi:glycerol-3-phosphate dehydrogenase